MMARGRIDRVCGTCGNSFKVWPSLVAYGGGKFCSIACSRPRNPDQKLCETCGASFEAWPSTGRRYCSLTCRPGPPVRDPFERFQAYVYPEPNSGCWLWGGADHGGGYGSFFDGTRLVKAHRASWTFHHGPIPRGKWVLHRCDNPPCVNPDHLFLGTNADNMADMAQKGRSRVPAGENNVTSKLKNSDIKYIRLSSESNVALGKRFNVSNVLISKIRKRTVWRHVL